MSELLVCRNQYNGSIGFYAYNSEKIFMYNEKIEKKNLYAIVKINGSYEIVKVVGLADCLIDKVKLSGVAIEVLDLAEEQINASYYNVREEKEDGTN